MQISVRGKILHILPQRALLWKSKKTLIISDLHLGKISHFRKNGIGIPSSARFNNLIQLEKLILNHHPKEVWFLGDLFHSTYNLEWDEFGKFVSAFEDVDFTLVEGNHDILKPHHYARYNIKTTPEIRTDELLFTHEPDDSGSDHYNIYGHIHPGVKLKGKGRQSMKLPCFYFGQSHGILPAFSDLTGKYILKPKPRDRVFVTTNDEVIEVTPK
jgi:DNA ligase-associated metallophosphoesterase